MARTTIVVVVAAVCVLAVVAALVYAADIFLILFLAILFGVFLTRISSWLSDHLPLSYLASLGIVTSVLLLLQLAAVLFCGVMVDSQIAKAREHFNTASQSIQKLAEQYPVVKSVLASTPFLHALVDDNGHNVDPDRLPSKPGVNSELATDVPESAAANAPASSDDTNSEEALPAIDDHAIRNSTQKVVSALAGVFKTTFGLLVNSVLIFFVGLYLAAAPRNYREGIVVLFPIARRERIREILDSMGKTLWDWLIGQFGSMLVTGMGAVIVLLALRVPMAVTLGILTGLLTFIPNLGALASWAITVLFAIPLGTFTVAAVTVAMLVLQLVESYIVTPYIQNRQVSQPPALQIAAQAVMGVLFGLLGTAVAAPMLVIAKVGVEEMYIKDVLESDTEPEEIA